MRPAAQCRDPALDACDALCPDSTTGAELLRHELTRLHVKCLGDVVQPLEEQPALAVLDFIEDRPRDARFQGQLLLSETALLPQLADSSADGRPPTFPCGHALRTVLTRSRRHAHQ